MLYLLIGCVKNLQDGERNVSDEKEFQIFYGHFV